MPSYYLLHSALKDCQTQANESSGPAGALAAVLLGLSPQHSAWPVHKAGEAECRPGLRVELQTTLWLSREQTPPSGSHAAETEG